MTSAFTRDSVLLAFSFAVLFHRRWLGVFIALYLVFECIWVATHWPQTKQELIELYQGIKTVTAETIRGIGL